MTDYPYIKNTAKLKDFLQKIPSLGTPKSVSTRWLPKVGFKSAKSSPHHTNYGLHRIYQIQ